MLHVQGFQFFRYRMVRHQQPLDDLALDDVALDDLRDVRFGADPNHRLPIDDDAGTSSRVKAPALLARNTLQVETFHFLLEEACKRYASARATPRGRPRPLVDAYKNMAFECRHTPSRG